MQESNHFSRWPVGLHLQSITARVIIADAILTRWALALAEFGIDIARSERSTARRKRLRTKRRFPMAHGGHWWPLQNRGPSLLGLCFGTSP
jgi:hypothetical protein